MEEYRKHTDVLFLQLSPEARSNAIKQMVKINQQENLYQASTPGEFAELIVDGYNPDRDFMFIQYKGDANDEVTVYFKDFS